MDRVTVLAEHLGLPSSFTVVFCNILYLNKGARSGQFQAWFY
jgi:hypothetical protein